MTGSDCVSRDYRLRMAGVLSALIGNARKMLRLFNLFSTFQIGLVSLVFGTSMASAQSLVYPVDVTVAVTQALACGSLQR